MTSLDDDIEALTRELDACDRSLTRRFLGIVAALQAKLSASEQRTEQLEADIREIAAVFASVLVIADRALPDEP